MYTHILMPTDGSACSEGALKHGLELAKQLGARVSFIYVVEDPLTAVASVPEAVNYQPELYEDLKKAGIAALESAQALADHYGVTAHSMLKEHHNPVAAILEAAKDHDLIVMGTHGRRGFDRFLFGSVAEGVLRRTSIPHLMIRHGHVDEDDDGA